MKKGNAIILIISGSCLASLLPFIIFVLCFCNNNNHNVGSRHLQIAGIFDYPIIFFVIVLMLVVIFFAVIAFAIVNRRGPLILLNIWVIFFIILCGCGVFHYSTNLSDINEIAFVHSYKRRLLLGYYSHEESGVIFEKENLFERKIVYSLYIPQHTSWLDHNRDILYTVKEYENGISIDYFWKVSPEDVMTTAYLKYENGHFSATDENYSFIPFSD